MKADFGKSDPAHGLYLKCLEAITSMTHVRYTTTHQLVNEAAGCHEARCYVAAAVICRGALEATLHETYAWKKIDGKLFLESSSLKLKRLIEWAKNSSLLTDDEARVAHRIQEKGNVGAHLKQRIDAQYFKGKAPDEPYPLWIDPKESLDLIESTVELVMALVKRVLKAERISS